MTVSLEAPSKASPDSVSRLMLGPCFWNMVLICGGGAWRAEDACMAMMANRAALDRKADVD